jgi:O-antigen/teichoic acid export membrane protein
MFWGAQPVGLFGASLTLANLAIQGPLMLTWSLLPHMSEKFGRKDLDGLRTAYAQGTRIMAFIAFPACIGLAALMSEVMPLLYGEAFAAAAPTATMLVIAGAVSATAIVGTNLIWAMDRSDVDFYISLAGAVLSVAGAFVLIMPFGELGAAASRISVQMICVALGVWFLVAKLKVVIPAASLLRLLFSALLCAAAAYGALELVSGLLGLAVAIAVAIPVYLGSVRLTGALAAEDVDALAQAAGHFPGSAMRRIASLVRLLHPVSHEDGR